MCMITALIPAYCPDNKLIGLVRELEEHNVRCVIVNDGSPAEYDRIFEGLPAETEVIRLERNSGKGTALKTGMKYIDENIRSCIAVTADADGQHLPEDIMRTAHEAEKEDRALVLGVRSFSEDDVPFRSYYGNKITETVFRFLTGVHVSDTQTGLRAFRSELIPELLEAEGSRYEYEMNQLLYCIQKKIPIREVGIHTVYEGNNEGSHFHPFRDSWKIYSGILKFSLASFSSFLVDFLLFALFSRMFKGTYSLALANVLARFLSASFNYEVNRTAVFHDTGSRKRSLIRYLLLAACILACNTAMLYVLASAGISATAAKIMTELILFAASWTIQNRFVFSQERRSLNQ